MPGSTSPQALQDTPITPWAGLPIPPGRCAWLSIPATPAGHSDHPLGRTPRPPRPVCPVVRPHRPCKTLRPPPGQDSPSPQAVVPGSTSPQALQDTPTTSWAGLPIHPGRCAQVYVPTGPARHSDHPLGRTPHPPRPVRPVLPPHRPCKTLRPPPGQDSPSPQAGVPGSMSAQALQDTLTTPWADLPIPPGRCARFYVPTGPARHSDQPLGRTPHPPRPVRLVVHPRSPCWTLRPPPGQDSMSPQAGVPSSTSPQALKDTLTTPWAGLPVPPGRCARFYVPTGSARHFDHPLGGTPHPPRPVCPVLHPHRPSGTLRPPPGQDSPSPQAGVPGCTSPQALQDTPTTPWAGLPIPPGRCARVYVPTGPAGHSDHLLGRSPHPPRPVRPGLRPHRPCKTLRPPPGQDSPSPQAGAPGSTSPQALQDTPTTPWAGLPIPSGRCARFYVRTGPARHSDHPLGRSPHTPRPVCPVLRPHRPCKTLRPPPGKDSPSPQAGAPGCPSPQPLLDTSTTPWAGLHVPQAGAPSSTSPQALKDTPTTPLGRTPRPPRLVRPVVHPRSPCRTLRPPPGQDSPSPQAGVPGSTSPQALQDTLTTPWAGLPIPPGRCARFYIPTDPPGHSDHPLGRTPRPPRPVCPVVRPRRPCKTLRPPPRQDYPSPHAGVPGSTSP